MSTAASASSSAILASLTPEVLHLESKMSSFAAKRIESYFHWRLTGADQPENLTEDERSIAQRFYNEVMLRYIVGYANFTDPEIYRTGFSKLLSYPEFNDTLRLAGCLSLFENAHSMRLLLKDCSSKNSLQYWIGEAISTPIQQIHPTAQSSHAPIGSTTKPSGAIGIIGKFKAPLPASLPSHTQLCRCPKHMLNPQYL